MTSHSRGVVTDHLFVNTVGVTEPGDGEKLQAGAGAGQARAGYDKLQQAMTGPGTMGPR